MVFQKVLLGSNLIVSFHNHAFYFTRFVILSLQVDFLMTKTRRLISYLQIRRVTISNVGDLNNTGRSVNLIICLRLTDRSERLGQLLNS